MNHRKRRINKRLSIKYAAASLCLFLILVTVAAAYTVTYSYDDVGRLISVDYDDDKFIDYHYDKASNLISRLTGTKLLGNIHPDGEVNLKDAILALQIIARLPSDEVITQRGDVNDDNKVGLQEVICILRTIAGR